VAGSKLRGPLFSGISETSIPHNGIGVLLALLALTQVCFPSVAHAQQVDTPQTLEEVTVTGSRIVRDGMAAPTPVTVISSARLQDLATPNIGSVLNTLPSFRASTGPSTNNIQPREAGSIQADLRGLGPNRTLVLVDGHRFVPSTIEQTVDLNQIPSLLVQRAEVVTGGASAQYGSDAVAGVVNILLNTKLEGVQTQLQYGRAEAGDGKDTIADLAAGTGSGNNRGHIVAAVEYEDNRGEGNCYTRDWCAREYQDVTNPSTPTVPKLAGYPANNILPNTHTVTAVPGGLIVSGPLKGTAFGPDGTPYAFQYGQVFPNNSTFMVGGQGYNGFTGPPLLVVPVKRAVGFLETNYDFTASLQGELEFSYGRVEANGVGAQTRDTSAGSVITIHGDNPYLPTAVRTALTTAGLPLSSSTSFTLGRLGDDFGDTENTTTTNLFRGLAGLKGQLGGSWKWDAYYQYGRTRYDQTVANNRIQEQIAGVPLGRGQLSRIQLAADAVVDPVSGQTVCRSTLTSPSNGCQPVNLFGLNRYSSAARAYLYGTAYQHQIYEQHVVAANLQGDLFHTWAGAVPLAAGFEYRQNDVATTADPISQTSGFYVFNSAAVQGSIHLKEGYLETSVPLATEQSWARSLQADGAERVTDYNTSGTVTTSKYGLIYEPTSWLRLRASRSRDIRAPNTDELYRPLTTAFQTVDGALTPSVSGGNTHLVPEVAKTTTYGFAVMGAGPLEGVRLSVDYYKIDIEDAIATLTPQVLVNRCRQLGAYCDLVTFASNGTVAQVSTLFQNLNRVFTSGFDIELNYRRPLPALSNGALDVNFLATRLEHLTTTDVTGLSIDRAGVAGNNVSGGGAGLPKWQMNGLVTLSSGPASFTVETRYIQAGLFDATLVGPEQAGYNVNLPNSINTNHVAGAVYVNLGARYVLPVPQLKSFEVYVGVQNLLDRDPPVAPSNQGATNNILFDTLGRTYRLGVRAGF
jgi:iron complex outermembrane recepter protein